MKRSLVLGALLATLLAACAKKDAGAVCTRCHMTIAPTDPSRVTFVYLDDHRSSFDSIPCAMDLYSTQVKSMRVIEYYTGVERDAHEVVFVEGTDIASPMPDDWIPVDPAHAKKLETDHGMKRELKFDELVATLHGRLQ